VRLSAEIDSEVESQSKSELSFAVTLRVSCSDQLTFHIHATFLVRYGLATDVVATAREVEAFRQTHAVLTAWPYLREFIQNLAIRMGFPVEPLPMLKLASSQPGKAR
jgi:preprotein translocase subunit SecB